MRVAGRRVVGCRLANGPARRQPSRSGQRRTLPFDPEFHVALSVPTSIRRSSLRKRRFGWGTGIEQFNQARCGAWGREHGLKPGSVRANVMNRLRNLSRHASGSAEYEKYGQSRPVTRRRYIIHEELRYLLIALPLILVPIVILQVIVLQLSAIRLAIA